MSTQPKHEGEAVESRNFSANSFYALTAHTRAKEEEVRGRREMTELGAREREREQPEEKEEGRCHPFFSFLVTNVGVANLQIEFTIESRGLLFQPAMPCILTYPPRLPCSPSLPSLLHTSYLVLLLSRCSQHRQFLRALYVIANFVAHFVALICHHQCQVRRGHT